MNNQSSSALYGRGVFSTIRIFDAKSFLWAKHWHRLTVNAAKLGIDISEYDEQSVSDSLAEVISKNEVKDGRARITFSDESQSELWGGDGTERTRLSIITAKRREILENFRLTVSPHRINTTSPLVGIKSCNYLEHIMANEEAKSRGFHEAIRLNESGEVASACMANLFWLNGDRLYTPSLKTGCLAGTTREFVLENLECSEVETGIEAIQQADAIFLTSAGIGVVQVAEIDEKQLEVLEHPILDLLPARTESHS